MFTHRKAFLRDEFHFHVHAAPRALDNGYFIMIFLVEIL